MGWRVGDCAAVILSLADNGKNVGTEPVRLVISVMGEKRKPFTVRKEEVR